MRSLLDPNTSGTDVQASVRTSSLSHSPIRHRGSSPSALSLSTSSLLTSNLPISSALPPQNIFLPHSVLSDTARNAMARTISPADRRQPSIPSATLSTSYSTSSSTFSSSSTSSLSSSDGTLYRYPSSPSQFSAPIPPIPSIWADRTGNNTTQTIPSQVPGLRVSSNDGPAINPLLIAASVLSPAELQQMRLAGLDYASSYRHLVHIPLKNQPTPHPRYPYLAASHANLPPPPSAPPTILAAVAVAGEKGGSANALFATGGHLGPESNHESPGDEVDNQTKSAEDVADDVQPLYNTERQAREMALTTQGLLGEDGWLPVDAVSEQVAIAAMLEADDAPQALRNVFESETDINQGGSDTFRSGQNTTSQPTVVYRRGNAP